MRCVVAFTACLVATFSLAGSAFAQTPALQQKSSAAAEIAAAAAQKNYVRVIVQFAPPAADANLRAGDAAAIAAVKSGVAATQDAIIGAHFGGSRDPAPGQGFARGLTRFETTPGFAINVTMSELEALAADPRVTAISPDALNAPQLNQSVPLIGMPAAYTAGATGSGYAVAVLDTGTQVNHKFLAGKFVGAACFSAGDGNGVSLCPNGQTTQTGVGASEATIAACISNGNNGCTHGGHVAGIAVGFNTALIAGEPINGVAKDAKLLDIQVFTRFDAPTDCGGAPPCVLTFTSDQIRALEYVLANLTIGGSKIAAVNMSLGGGTKIPGNCDGDPRKIPIDQLRALGVLTVIASGNSSNPVGISAPGCISSAVTVGSTTKDDQVSSFTDMSDLVDLMAPGSFPSGACTDVPNVNIRSALSGLNAGDNAGFFCIAGTSMAAPHVAGAIAAMRTVCPSAPADALETALKSTGLVVPDQRAGGTWNKPRIRVDQAIAALTCDKPTTLVSAILPASRSVQIGATATAFATAINTGANAGNGCALSLGGTIPGTFGYQTTNPATNAVTGTPNTAASIAAGGVQSFVFGITPSAVVASTDLPIVVTCANGAVAPAVVGLNTLQFSASASAVADIVALAATPANNGILSITGTNGTAAFSVATVNVGAAAAITASADTGSVSLPLTLNLCPTNASTGACLSPPAPTATGTIGANETPTFSIFAQASGAVAFDPAKNRIFVRFKGGDGATHGSTSVAVRTQ